MASKLLSLHVLVVMVVSLLCLLLQSSAVKAAVPHIEMVRGSSNDKYHSSSNDNCNYRIFVTPTFTTPGSSNFTFDLYDKNGNSIRFSCGVRFDLPINQVEGSGPCINRPCNLVIRANDDDGTEAFFAYLVKAVHVTVVGRGKDDIDVTFLNMDKQWISPAEMQLQINNYDRTQQ